MASSGKQQPPAWAVALMAAVEDLTLEVRGWRADQARRRAANEQDGRDALLGVLIARIVADQPFSASDIMARAVQHLELGQALAFAGVSNGRKLGHLLVRLGGRGIDGGIHFVRIGTDRGAALWKVLRD